MVDIQNEEDRDDDAKSGDGSDDHVAIATVESLREKFDQVRREMDQCVMDIEDVREYTELSLEVRRRMRGFHKDAADVAERTQELVSTLEIMPRFLKGEGPRGFKS
jgi:hypothetical protein